MPPKATTPSRRFVTRLALTYMAIFYGLVIGTILSYLFK